MIGCWVCDIVSATPESKRTYRLLWGGAHDLSLDIAQPILAEKYFVTDEECRSTKGTARNRFLSILQQPIFDVRLLSASKQSIGVAAGLIQHVAHHLGVVHLFLIGPYCLEHRLDVAREHALKLRGDRTPHDQ